MDPIISSTTTLGHLSALPALVRSGDVIIMDEQAHNSMQMAAKLCIANGTQAYKCRHADMTMLETMVRDKNPGGDNRIWYIADGLYSMRGDFIDMPGLFELMKKFPALYAYIDDAHSFGWLNDCGCGHVANFYDHPLFDRIVLAGSLSKAYAAGGGCIFTKNEEFHAQLSVAGGPRIFSGPIQPSSLGAAIGAATLMLSDRFPEFQEQLLSNIQYARNVFDAHGVDFISSGTSPIFYVKVGVLEDVVDLCHYLYSRNYYVVPVGFPAVNHNDVGIRICVTRLHTHPELEGLVYAISKWNENNAANREDRLSQKVHA
jgi:7-keto-8-aminopelargonate synthetase-like enzyme